MVEEVEELDSRVAIWERREAIWDEYCARSVSFVTSCRRMRGECVTLREIWREREKRRRTIPLSALVTTIFALLANLSVESVSAACSASGLMVHTTATRELPDRAGWSSRVSFESR